MELGEDGLTGPTSLLTDTRRYRSEPDNATTQHQNVEVVTAMDLILRPERSMSNPLITKLGPISSNLTWK